MKNLEDIIKKNKDSFDDSEPSDGHFDRFRQKLDTGHAARKGNKVVMQALKIAAVFALVVMSSLWIYEHYYAHDIIVADNVHDQMILSKLLPEYTEFEVYYASQINQCYDRINNYDFSDDGREKQILLEELAAMDTLYSDLKMEFSENPYDERVINAMINHYQLKLKVLNHILNQLNNVKPQNQNKYESI